MSQEPNEELEEGSSDIVNVLVGEDKPLMNLAFRPAFFLQGIVEIIVEVRWQVRQVLVNLFLRRAATVDDCAGVGALENLVIVKLDDVGSILDVLFDLFVELLACDAKHENERGLDAVQQNFGQVGDVDELELEWEDQGLDCFAAVDKLDWVLTREEVARVQQHSLEEQQDVVYV